MRSIFLLFQKNGIYLDNRVDSIFPSNWLQTAFKLPVTWYDCCLMIATLGAHFWGIPRLWHAVHFSVSLLNSICKFSMFQKLTSYRQFCPQGKLGHEVEFLPQLESPSHTFICLIIWSLISSQLLAILLEKEIIMYYTWDCFWLKYFSLMYVCLQV